ncbi:hypothetical protein [Hydrogenobacter thermophilus]|uniref:hypothetical protein n=1 Tax=Hydrogenobacter thermophilus TaxID=940 RepID=UPI0018E0937C|nr:hypothetical protein [Hydrogenobacter thermophilus]
MTAVLETRLEETTTKLVALFMITASRGAKPKSFIKKGRRNSAPPKTYKPSDYGNKKA